MLRETSRFQVKLVRWSHYEHETPILLQDKNGPCPLIALVNTLLFKNTIEFRTYNFNKPPLDTSPIPRNLDRINELERFLSVNIDKTVRLDDVLSHVGDILLVLNENNDSGVSDFSIDTLLESLPLLHTGLTVNPNLVNGAFPSQDKSSVLFEKFGLTFKHGWCVDQVHNEEFQGDYDRLVELINKLETFDKIQDFLLLDDASQKKDQELVQNWLDLNKTQLTPNGLKKLNMALRVDEFVVFFRNNHFSTLYKRDHNDFYLLITDTAFNKVNTKQIVWQSLISVSGKDDLFFTGDFIPVFDDVFDRNENNSDMLLVRQLQEEEDQALAQLLQKKYTSKKPPPGQTVSNKLEPPKKSASKTGKSAQKEKKKKSDCIIT